MEGFNDEVSVVVVLAVFLSAYVAVRVVPTKVAVTL
jgi:hypothetical protein